MDWLPPIEVSRISDGGKVRPHKELFLIQSDYSVRYGLTLFFSYSYRKNSLYSSLHSLSWRLLVDQGLRQVELKAKYWSR